MSPLFRFVHSMSHGSWITALTGGLIPLLQVGWKWWHQRNLKSQGEKLRQKVVELQTILDALKNEIGDTRNAQLLEDAERKRAEAVSELSQLATAGTAQKTPELKLIQRWLLFYTPRNVWSWILHTLFYVCLTAAVAMSWALLSVPQTEPTDIRAEGVCIGIWLTLLFIIRTVTAAVDGVGKSTRLERWLLLEKPARASGWILRGFFYVSFTFALLLAATLAPMMRFDRESLGALFALGLFVAVPVSLRALIGLVERTRDPNRVERWLLLYRPRGLGGWILRIIFYLTLIITLVVLLAICFGPKDPDGDDEGTGAAIVLVAGVCFLARGIASAIEQKRRPTRVERWFLLYRPARRIGWIVHSLFYVWVIVVVVFASTIFDTSERVFAAEMMGFYFCLAVLFRGLAVEFDPDRSRSSARGKFRSAFLLYHPSKGILWIPHIVFYLLVVLFPVILVAPFENADGTLGVSALRENANSILRVYIPIILVAAGSRICAKHYERRAVTSRMQSVE